MKVLIINKDLWQNSIQKQLGWLDKRGKAKIDPTIHEAMEIILKGGMSRLYEKMDE